MGMKDSFWRRQHLHCPCLPPDRTSPSFWRRAIADLVGEEIGHDVTRTNCRRCWNKIFDIGVYFYGLTCVQYYLSVDCRNVRCLAALPKEKVPELWSDILTAIMQTKNCVHKRIPRTYIRNELTSETMRTYIRKLESELTSEEGELTSERGELTSEKGELTSEKGELTSEGH